MSLLHRFRPLLSRLPKPFSVLFPPSPPSPGEELVELTGYEKDYVRVKLHSVIAEIKEKHVFDPELIEAVETLHFGITYEKPVKRKFIVAVFPELGTGNEGKIQNEEDMSDPSIQSAPSPSLQYQPLSVSNLEQYKSLCEKRILELSPHHPMPVVEIHCGADFEGLWETHPREIASRSDSSPPFEPRLEAELARMQRIVAEQQAEISALKSPPGLSSPVQSPSEPQSADPRPLTEGGKAGCSCCQALESEKSTLVSLISSLESELKAVKTAPQGLSPLNSQSMNLQIDALTNANRTLVQQLSQVKSELTSALSQKAYFQSVYDAAKQEAGEKEASEFKAKGEIKELQKALQVMWDGTSAAARSAQARDEQLSCIINSLEREKFDMEMAVLKAKDACKRAVEDTKSIENEYKLRLKSSESQLESAKSETRSLLKAGEEEIKRLKEALNQTKTANRTEEMNKDTELRSISVQLAELQNQNRSNLLQIATLQADLSASKSRISVLESDLISSNLALEASKATILSLQADISALNSQLKSTTPVVVSADISFSDTRDRDHSEKVTALEGTIKSSFDQLCQFLTRLQAVLRIKKVNDFTHVSEVISALFELIPTIEPLILPDFRQIDILKSHVSEVSSIPDRFLNPESAPKSRSEYDTDLFCEVQTLRQQLSLERKSKIELNSELQALDFQLKCTVEELQQHRDQIREYAEENSHFHSENKQLISDLGRIEQELTDINREKDRIEGLLRKFLKFVPMGGGMKGLIWEILEVSEGILEVERDRKRLEERVGAMQSDWKDRPDSFRAMQIEKMTLLRSECEAETLQKRLRQLEIDLESFSTPSLRFHEPRFDSMPTSGARSPDFDYGDGKFDEKIAPYLSDSLRRRLKQARKREKRLSGNVMKEESRR